MSKKYLDYAGLKRVLAKLLPGARKIWHGTLDEWESLPLSEKEKYDQAEITETADDPNSDAVKSGDLKPLTSNGFAKFLNTIVSGVYASNWYYFNTIGWHQDQTAVIQNVPKGKYLVLFAVQGQFDGNGYVCGWCRGGTYEGYNVLSADSDIFANYALCPSVYTVNAAGNVNIKFGFYCSGGAATNGKAGARVLLFRIRDID